MINGPIETLKRARKPRRNNDARADTVAAHAHASFGA
jgi:hypothetical protein